MQQLRSTNVGNASVDRNGLIYKLSRGLLSPCEIAFGSEIARFFARIQRARRPVNKGVVHMQTRIDEARVAGAFAALTAVPTLAPAQTSESATQLEEVAVTARKRDGPTGTCRSPSMCSRPSRSNLQASNASGLHRAGPEHDTRRDAECGQRIRRRARDLAGPQQRALRRRAGRRRARNESRRSSIRSCSTSIRSKC